MINLPGLPATGSQTVAEVRSAADLARQQVSQTIQAVVQEARLMAETGANGKPVYEILLRATAAPGTAPPLATEAGTIPSSQAAPNQASLNQVSITHAPLTQITAQAIQALRQGQALLIKTQWEIPLTVGSQLLASVTPNSGVVIHRILPALVAASLSQALREWVPQQQGLAPLFQALEQTANQAGASRAVSVQALAASLLQQLPTPEQLRNADQVRQAIHNSGLFLENKIRQAVQQNSAASSSAANHRTSANPSSAATPPGAAPPPGAALVDSLKQASQHLRNVVSRQDSGGANASATATSKTPPLDLHRVVQGDVKHLLQQLQVKLEQAQNTLKAEAAHNAPQPSATPDKALPIDAKSPATPADSKPGQQPQPGQPLDARNRPVEGRTGEPPRTDLLHNTQRAVANRLQGYTGLKGSGFQGSGSLGSVPGDGTRSTLETYILPPLPGNIVLQPQARSKLSASGDMADALVSILLKQVKGAISRINLHQVASQPRSQDPAAPQPLLSFELPILHQNQVQIFQFRIEEEPSRDEQEAKTLGKRWVVQMAFDVEGLGPMLCQISMLGHSASVSFWAEWERTLEHTRRHFDYLQTVLTEMGLRVEKLQGHLGLPKSEQAILHNQLVDIRT
ncbi:MAG: hypothetical protein VYA55_06610 [Pseudomonadota bacterium]|nr:hypothetical protein [Pseudomonadota bacterium]